MAMVTPPYPVAAPTRTPLRFGLGSVVEWRDGSSDRWESGVTWVGLTCEPAGGRGGPGCEEVIPGTPHVEQIAVTGGVPTSGDVKIFTGTEGGAGEQAYIAYNQPVSTIHFSFATITGGPTIAEGPLIVTWNEVGEQPLTLQVGESTFDVGETSITVVEPGTDDETVGEIVGLPKTLDGGPSFGEATPFVVYGHDNCKLTGGSVAESQERANQHLLAREEQRMEQAFWSGDLGNTPNLKGSGAGIILGGAPQPLELALGYLEYEIGQLYGSTGVIHMTRGMALAALGQELVYQDGDMLRTQLGTPVVAGSGYDGEGPEGQPPTEYGQSWAYATPAVGGYKGEIIEASNRPGDLLDRTNNDMYAIAEREYLLGFDACGYVAVLIQLDTTADTTA